MAIEVSIDTLNIQAFDENRKKLKQSADYHFGLEYQENDLSIAWIVAHSVEVQMLQ